MRPVHVAALAAVFLVLPGCDRRQQAPAQASAPASAGEGMCAEHGVLEALCTKCNPRLIPMFQAKGDWCAEHGLPESVCPLCHPERGGRPAGDVATDGAPADGTRVRLKTAEAARAAGIRTARATEAPKRFGVEVPARIAFDPAKVARVDPPFAGVIRDVRVQVGDSVERGAALATVESAAVGADRSRLEALRSRVELAETTLRRERELQEKGISAAKDVLAAKQELDAARAELSASVGSLGLAGAGGESRYVLRSPIPGVVSARRAALGQLASGGEPLFEIADTSAVSAELDVPARLLAGVRPGLEASLSFDGVAGEVRGRIRAVSPQIDAATQTARATVPLANADGRLRANALGRARIEVVREGPDGGQAAGAMVPREAVQRAKTVQLVFVRSAADLFEARRVEVGAMHEGLVEVRGDIKPGDEVVTEGSFLLKTETLKESIGAGCCGD